MMNQDWTHDEFLRALDGTFDLSKKGTPDKQSIALDVSRASWRNVEQMIRWAAELGHYAKESNSDTLVVYRTPPEGTPEREALMSPIGLKAPDGSDVTFQAEKRPDGTFWITLGGTTASLTKSDMGRVTRQIRAAIWS